MTVLSYAKHAPRLNHKRFRQIENEQQILTQIPAQATLDFYIIINSMYLDLSIVLSTVKFINEII